MIYDPYEGKQVRFFTSEFRGLFFIEHISKGMEENCNMSEGVGAYKKV